MRWTGLLYEFWSDPGGVCTACLAGPDGDKARLELPAGARRMATVAASSNLELMTMYHRHLGWPPYVSDGPADRELFPGDSIERQRAALAIGLQNLPLAAAGVLLVEWWMTVARYRERSTRADEAAAQMLRIVEHLAASPLACQFFPSTSLDALVLSRHATYAEQRASRSVIIDCASGIVEIAYRDELGSVASESCSEFRTFNWGRAADWLSSRGAEASGPVVSEN